MCGLNVHGNMPWTGSTLQEKAEIAASLLGGYRCIIKLNLALKQQHMVYICLDVASMIWLQLRVAHV